MKRRFLFLILLVPGTELIQSESLCPFKAARTRCSLFFMHVTPQKPDTDWLLL